jgi:sterol desaturase/sphingolipid hydroxylase (fatty acid hydroxylase superfamily)
MSQWLIANEPWIRLSIFAGVLILMAAWEWLAQRRPRLIARSTRWTSRVAVVAINTAAVRFLLPATAVGMALLAENVGWGFLNRYAFPDWLALIAGVVALDFVIYLQHVMFHAVPALWHVHRVHHADLDFDTTTGIRFHPVEILLSMLIKYAAIVALGAPPAAVLIFEVLLNATSLFNHGNVRLPLRLDRWLRLLIVTPEMHRVHHSVLVHETNSNFGFNLPWWDRLLGTYKDQPDTGHDGMTIGLDGWRDEKLLERLPGILMLPFNRPIDNRYPINRRRK